MFTCRVGWVGAFCYFWSTLDQIGIRTVECEIDRTRQSLYLQLPFFLTDDGGPPRWFSPLIPAPPERAPLMLFLPGLRINTHVLNGKCPYISKSGLKYARRGKLAYLKNFNGFVLWCGVCKVSTVWQLKWTSIYLSVCRPGWHGLGTTITPWIIGEVLKFCDSSGHICWWFEVWTALIWFSCLGFRI